MSALAALSVKKPLTTSGHKTIAQAGVLNTDYADISLVPVGIDKNNVAKYRQSLTAIAEAIQASFGTNVAGRKVSSRIVVIAPITVTENGVSVVKPITFDLRVTSDIGHSTLNRKVGFNIGIDVLNTLGSDILDGTSAY